MFDFLKKKFEHNPIPIQDTTCEAIRKAVVNILTTKIEANYIAHLIMKEDTLGIPCDELDDYKTSIYDLQVDWYKYEMEIMVNQELLKTIIPLGKTVSVMIDEHEYHIKHRIIQNGEPVITIEKVKT